MPLEKLHVDHHIAVNQYPYTVRVYFQDGSMGHTVSDLNLDEALHYAAYALENDRPWQIFISQTVTNMPGQDCQYSEHYVFTYVDVDSQEV